MEREEKIQLTKRLIAHVDHDSTDYADDLLRVPFSVFDDPELARKELAVVRRFPHIVAHLDEFEKTGSFVTTDLMGTPLLLVKQSDGTIRAFSNVCRHRGSKVEFAESGCKRVFSCPYTIGPTARTAHCAGCPMPKVSTGWTAPSTDSSSSLARYAIRWSGWSRRRVRPGHRRHPGAQA